MCFTTLDIYKYYSVQRNLTKSNVYKFKYNSPTISLFQLYIYKRQKLIWIIAYQPALEYASFKDIES